MNVSNFIKGFGDTLNVYAAAPKNPVANKSTTDILKENWRTVGDNIKDSLRKIENEIATQK